MRILQLLVSLILTAACCVIATFLYLDWAAKPLTPVGPASSSGYTLEMLAVNITILEIVLALVGFLVAVIGFFGYTGIKSASVEAAEKEARKVANDQMMKWRVQQQQDSTNKQSESDGDFTTEQAPVDQAIPAGQEE